MAKQKISEFNSNPALNTDIDSINLAEGCAPSGINDAIRELMAQLKDWQSGTSNDPYVVGSSGSLTLNQGTANGVAYLNGSKVVTSGSALTFDGTNLSTTAATHITGGSGTGSSNGLHFWFDTSTNTSKISSYNAGVDDRDLEIYGKVTKFYAASSEGMRLTSTGLGIGTSSPAYKLDVSGSAPFRVNTTANNQMILSVSGTAYSQIAANSSSALVVMDGGATGTLLNLTQAGNLGLGVTPSAWNLGKVVEVGNAGNAIWGISAGDIAITQGVYYNSGEKYANSSYAVSKYEQYIGSHRWYTAPSGTAGNTISFTQAMTLDASGNLMVGATSAVGRFTLENSSTTTEITLRSTGGVGTNNRARIIAGYESGGSNYGGYLAFNTTSSSNGNNEAARIDSSGNLLINQTSGADGKLNVTNGNGGTICTLNSGGTSPAYAIQFKNTNGTIGNITVSGTTTAYNTSSDYRLKNTITPMTGALAKVALLKPCTYKWNADGSDGEGFIAHELAKVVPQAVTGEKDAVDENGNPKYQGIDTSFLVATLTSALQELNAKFESLKARLDAANL